MGVTPTLIYDGAVAANTAGGMKEGIVYTGSVHFQLLADGGVLAGKPELKFYVDVLNTHGGQPSGLVADVQGVSNVAAPAYTRVYEAWAQYSLPDASVLIGRFDLNSEFYRLSSSSLFLNSSFGSGPEFSQSGPAGASVYPDTAVGVRVSYKPDPTVIIRVALMDGAPVERPAGQGGIFSSADGIFLMSEIALLTRPGEESKPGALRSLIGRMSSLPPYEDKVALGGWYYTTSVSDLSEHDAQGAPLQNEGSGGGYVLFDQRLFEDGTSRVNGFLQLGWGDPRSERVASYIGLGLAATGLVVDRPNDQSGISLAIAGSGSHFQRAALQAGQNYSVNEVTLEGTYIWQAADWLALQPDVQFVMRPGAAPGLGNALVFQLEFEASL
jgi:porin